MSDPIVRRLDARREVLMLRLDRVMEAQARGEGATTWLELELLSDEMEHLLDLYRTMWLMQVRRRLEIS